MIDVSVLETAGPLVPTLTAPIDPTLPPMRLEPTDPTRPEPIDRKAEPTVPKPEPTVPKPLVPTPTELAEASVAREETEPLRELPAAPSARAPMLPKGVDGGLAGIQCTVDPQGASGSSVTNHTVTK